MGIRDSPALKRVRRLDSIRLDKADSTYFTDEGYLVDHPILTSCGIFEYVNSDGSIRRELRLPKYVFDEDSLKTYRGKPIIITHDAGVVDKSNVDKEQIGTILSDGYKDGNDVRAEIIIHDTDAMKDSGLKELSLGYNLDLIEEPGVYKGEHYDAIQTNIVINHLAIVASARAGEQARLNIDGKEEPELKGGKMRSKRYDGELSPEELEQAMKLYRESQGTQGKAQSKATEGVDGNEGEPTKEPVTEGKSNEGDEPKVDGDTTEGLSKGATPEDIVNTVKEHKAGRDDSDGPKDVEAAKTVINQQDADIDMLLAAIEKLLSEKGATPGSIEDNTEGENNDGSGDDSKSLNADSADKIVRQRLSICRVGDKLNMDGLENMSIEQAKKTIIAKVLPNMRLDGKSNAYIDAMYDLAVGEVKKKKDVAYQRQQMTAQVQKNRLDSGESMAMLARKKMIAREGGNE